MKKGRKLFSTLQQTDISLSVSIKCRKIASKLKVIVWSIQPCFIEINSQKFFCASKSPNESDDNFLEKIQYIFEYQLTIEFADPFNNLWSLSGDKYSRLKIDTPYPINFEKKLHKSSCFMYKSGI